MGLQTLHTCCEQVGRRGKDYERRKFTPKKNLKTQTFAVFLSFREVASNS
jgi:hypothetical protein